MRRMISSLALMVTIFASVAPGSAATFSIAQTVNRDQLRSACASAGVTFSANLEGHGCITQCTSSSGQAGTCSVGCNANGQCTGSTPGRIAPLLLDDILGNGASRR